MKIKISIVDDHHLIVSSIKNALDTAGYFELCGAYNNGAELLEGLKTTNPEVLLLDYHLPDLNGAQLVRIITYHHPDVKILVLTGFDKPGLSTEMLESGCSGYLLKTSAKTDTLLEAIHEVYEGKLYLDKALKEKFADNVHKAHKPKPEQPKLTKREQEILAMIVNEKSSQEIADLLYISKKTVDNHRSSILMKTGTKNTLGLIKLAWELKLV